MEMGKKISFDECDFSRDYLEKVGTEVLSQEKMLFCGLQLYEHGVAFYGLRSGEKYVFSVTYKDIEDGNF